MKVYPAIYEAVDGNKYLYTSNSDYYSYQREIWDKSDGCDNHEDDTNITREYLANTYGKIESKGHAEFIVRLAENSGFTCLYGVISESFRSFYFDSKTLFFTSFDINHSHHMSLITLPLPPKEPESKDMDRDWET